MNPLLTMRSEWQLRALGGRRFGLIQWISPRASCARLPVFVTAELQKCSITFGHLPWLRAVDEDDGAGSREREAVAGIHVDADRLVEVAVVVVEAEDVRAERDRGVEEARLAEERAVQVNVELVVEPGDGEVTVVDCAATTAAATTAAATAAATTAVTAAAVPPVTRSLRGTGCPAFTVLLRVPVLGSDPEWVAPLKIARVPLLPRPHWTTADFPQCSPFPVMVALPPATAECA